MTLALAFGLAACGGSTNNTPAPSAPSPATPSAAAAPSAPSAASSSSAASNASTSGSGATAQATAPAASNADEAYDDPNESATPIAMAPLLGKSTPKSSYPKATVGDKECWQRVNLSGEHDKDYQAIITSCGTPTGLLEYAKPVSGKLHHIKDKRDTYTLKLAGKMCYRYFAVADSGIKDLDILVEKPGGALVADDKQTSPVAIVDGDKAWCMDEDAEYNFEIEVDGVGKGRYTFGVWAKPKK